MSGRFFTREEAESLLPKIEPIVHSLMEHRKSVVEMGRSLALIQERMRSGESTDEQATDLINRRTELEFLMSVISEGLDAIEALGGQIKDLDLGLVDFPSILDGKEVLLCWRHGEQSIGYYHELSDGYAGRKPLPKRA